jgi:hypothetical protein
MRTGHSEIVRKPASRLCRLGLEVLESRWQPARLWFSAENLVFPSQPLESMRSDYSFKIEVNSTFQIGDLDIKLQLDYANVSELAISVVSPTGNSVPFFENRGGSAKTLDIIVDDEALQTTSSGPLIPGNRYRNLDDESQLSLLDNLPAFGSWTINISTDNNQEVLFIRSLALGLTSNTDDHGATPQQASQLVETKGEGLIFSESGRIENPGDVDSFVFQAQVPGIAEITLNRQELNDFLNPVFAVKDLTSNKDIVLPPPSLAERQDSKYMRDLPLIQSHRYLISIRGVDNSIGNYGVSVSFPGDDQASNPSTRHALRQLQDPGNQDIDTVVFPNYVGSGDIAFVGDQDWFRWNSPQTAGIRVTVMAEDGSLLNAHLELADKSGNILVATEPNDDLKRWTRLFYQANRNTDYFIKIRAPDFAPEQLGRYTVLLQVVPDDVPDSAPLDEVTGSGSPSIWTGSGRLETLADTDTFTFTPKKSGQIQLDLAGAGMDRLLTDLTISNGSSSGVKVQHTVRKGGRVIAIASVVAGQEYKVEARSKRFAPAGQRYGDYQLKVSMFAEAEEGTGPANAKPLVRNEVANSWSIRGRIDLEGDTDMWSWVAPKTMMVSMVMKPATGVGLNPVMTLLDANGVAIPAQSSRLGNAWIISFTAIRNRTYFMELKADDAASASEGGTGDYQMNLSQVKDDYGDTRLLGSNLQLNALDTGLAMGTIGAEDDQDWFVLKPEKTGSLKVSSSTFSGSRQLPMVLITSADPAASSTMANSAVDQTIKAGSTYFVRVTAGSDTAVADSIGTFSISLTGVNLKVETEQIAQAIVSTGTEELIAAIETTTSTDDVPFIATDVVISTSDTEESTNIDEPIRGSRTVITMGEVERDPVVNLILASPFGKALIATSSIERTIPAGTYPAKKLLPEPVVAVVAPAFAALVRAADAAEYRVLMAIDFAGSSVESILTSMVPSEARTAWRNLMLPPESTQGVVVPEPATGKSPVSKSSSSFTRWLAGLAVIALIPRQQPTQTTIRGRKKWPSPFGSDFRDHESMGSQT